MKRKPRKTKKKLTGKEILYLDQYITKKRKETYLTMRLNQDDADIIKDAMRMPGILGNRSHAVRLILRQWNEHLNPYRQEANYE